MRHYARSAAASVRSSGVNFSHREIHARELMRTSLSAESICAKRDFPATHPDTLHPMKGRRNRSAKISLAVLALPNKAPIMPTRSEAEEHLRIIRSLMEKATIYRAISAPTALVGGLCSVLFGLWLHFRWRPLPRGTEESEFPRIFIIGWVGILVVTAFANAAFIRNAARRRNEPFISPAMRKALWALLPAMLCGGFFGAAFTFIGSDSVRWFLPQVWMLCYGLGLLATAQFSPRSIPILGWCFLIAGLLSFAFDYWLLICEYFGKGDTHRPTAANLLMAATFGAFHLIYAAFTWPRTASQSDSGSTL